MSSANDQGEVDLTVYGIRCHKCFITTYHGSVQGRAEWKHLHTMHVHLYDIRREDEVLFEEWQR